MHQYEQAISRIGDRPGTSLQSWLSRRLVERFLDNDKNCSILEVGTGVGRFAEQVVKLGCEYVGIEPTKTLRDAANDRLTRHGFGALVVDDSLPELSTLDDRFFTHGAALHVIEHASSSEVAIEWLTAISQRVEADGKILIVCPNAMDLGIHFYNVDWTHQWVSTTSRIVSLGNEIGLEVVDRKDLRGTFSNPVIKAFLAIVAKLFPTELVDRLCLRILGLENFGSGIQSALFWRMSWVVFRKK